MEISLYGQRERENGNKKRDSAAAFNRDGLDGFYFFFFPSSFVIHLVESMSHNLNKKIFFITRRETFRCAVVRIIILRKNNMVPLCLVVRL